MAFDLYGDTFGGSFGSPNFFAPRPQPAAPILPEDESTLLGSVMERGLGGLAYLGKVLDKTFGGRAVRGLIGSVAGTERATPRELLSVLPFSDSLGITDERDVVHGKDLLTDTGLLTKGDDGWENTVAGLAADIALDPAMWVGAAVPRAVLGGLNRVAQPVAQGAGNIAQRATFGMVNPYTFAERVGDGAARAGRALFMPSYQGTWDAMQPIARDVVTPIQQAGKASAGAEQAKALVGLEPFTHGVNEGELYSALIQRGQGLHRESVLSLERMGFNPTDIASINDIADPFIRSVQATRAADNRIGLRTAEGMDVPKWKTESNARLDAESLALENEARNLWATAGRTNDPADVAAAQAADAAAQASRARQRFEIKETPYFPLRPAQWLGIEERGGAAAGKDIDPLIAREDILRGIPGRAAGVNDLVKDARFTGRDRTMNEAQVQHELTQLLTGYGGGAKPANFVGDDLAWAGARKQAEELEKFLYNLPTQARQHGLYSTDFVGAGHDRLMSSVKMGGEAEGLMTGIARFARPVAELEAGGQRFVRVPELLNGANLSHADPVSGGQIAFQRVARDLGVQDVNALKDMAIPADVAADMARMGQAFTVPGAIAPVVQAWDAVTNLFKTALTRVFPAFHMRNAMAGLFNQWRDGALTTAGLTDAMSVIRGGTVSRETALALGWGDNTVDATKRLLEEVIGGNVAFTRDARNVSETVGALTTKPGGMLPSQVPIGTGTRPVTEDIGNWLDVLKGGVGDVSWRNPKLRGVNSEVDKFAPVVAGNMVGQTVEDMVRTSHYLSKRLQGATPSEAAIAVKKYHIDYGNMTQFEQNVMKRLFPWYSYSSRNLPVILEDLATRPAKLAATTRLVTGTREPGEFVPPWIAEGAAVPFPFNEPEGQKRFISSFGLPVEDELVKTAGAVAQGDISRVFQQLFGMSQPFVKLPAELATGTQMYSGRKLEDLRPYEFATLGGVVPEDVARRASQVIANTPLSRFGSTFDKFIDERKGAGETILNALSGGRITDVEVDKVKERAAQEQLKKMLRGQPGVKARDEVYVPKDQLQRLSPDDLMTYSLLKEIEQRSQQRAREAKKAAGR